MFSETMKDAAEQAAKKVAAWYARRVFWADPQDLLQEARYWALRALSTSYDPSTNVPMSAYAEGAARRRLYEWCWQNTAPVNEVEARFRDLKDVRSVGFDTPLSANGAGAFDKKNTVGDYLADPRPNPEEEFMASEGVDAAKARDAEVREQILYLLRKKSDQYKDIALTLLDEDPKTAREIAKARGLPERDVYRIREKTKEMLSENAYLYEVWKEYTA